MPPVAYALARDTPKQARQRLWKPGDCMVSARSLDQNSTWYVGVNDSVVGLMPVMRSIR